MYYVRMVIYALNHVFYFPYYGQYHLFLVLLFSAISCQNVRVNNVMLELNVLCFVTRKRSGL